MAEREAAIQALSRFGEQYRARRELLARESQELQDERDRKILDAFAKGVTTREIAKLIGISHQRVAQIVRRR
jgi:DNA-directed RNA polymerase specialized sigma subunit